MENKEQSQEQALLQSADFQAGQQAVQPAQVQIDDTLKAQLGAIRGVATAHNLLDKGLFNHQAAEAVRLSLDFLRSLHLQLVEEAIKHPQADLIPELSQYKGGQDGESK